VSGLLDALSMLDAEDVPEYLQMVRQTGEQSIANHIHELWNWEGAFARPEQCEPEGEWDIWLVNAGRGFGKTRTGGEWLRSKAQDALTSPEVVRLALVGRTAPDVRDTMVEGESGLLAISPPKLRPKYEPSKRKLTWIDGDRKLRCEAHCYTAEEPDLLRGPQHHYGWADELASWKYAIETYDNLLLGLRLGDHPQLVATTTPRPTILLKDLIADPTCVVTGGSTYDNQQNLPDKWLARILRRFEGTAKGEQELYARILDEAEGALWKREWIDNNRVTEHPDLLQLFVAVDPSVGGGGPTDDGAETGIIIVGMAYLPDRMGHPVAHFYVLDDYSLRDTPNNWGRKTIEAYHEFRADRVIGEGNNGGDLIRTIIHNIDPLLSFEMVWASRGKAPRAEPVSMLYEQGRVHHVAKRDPRSGLTGWEHFRIMEDQLCQWEPGKPNQPSPDRLDALVWGVTKLMPEGFVPSGMNLDQGLGKASHWNVGGAR
jgi:phage terminase large subunit-like protein